MLLTSNNPPKNISSSYPSFIHPFIHPIPQRFIPTQPLFSQSFPVPTDSSVSKSLPPWQLWTWGARNTAFHGPCWASTRGRGWVDWSWRTPMTILGSCAMTTDWPRAPSWKTKDLRKVESGSPKRQSSSLIGIREPLPLSSASTGLESCSSLERWGWRNCRFNWLCWWWLLVIGCVALWFSSSVSHKVINCRSSQH